jgi:uncharacterized membrane-anchored protein
MQGDYMVLAYAIADDAQKRMPRLPRSGAMVVRVDAAAASPTWSRASTTAARSRRRAAPAATACATPQLRLGAESYFFPEGTGDRYEGAAFGEVIAAASGESVLVALRDGEHRRLGTPLH